MQVDVLAVREEDQLTVRADLTRLRHSMGGKIGRDTNSHVRHFLLLFRFGPGIASEVAPGPYYVLGQAVEASRYMRLNRGASASIALRSTARAS